MSTSVINTWSIEGDPKKLNIIRKAIQDNVFDFDKLIPIPEELNQTKSSVKIFNTQSEADKYNKLVSTQTNAPESSKPIAAISREESLQRLQKYSATTWSTFRLINWGTEKLGWIIETLLDKPNQLIIRFGTQWDAPLPIAEHIKSLGLQVYGGTIYENDNEFELLDDNQNAFDERFVVIETVKVEGYGHWASMWTIRSIELNKKVKK